MNEILLWLAFSFYYGLADAGHKETKNCEKVLEKVFFSRKEWNRQQKEKGRKES